MSSGIFTVINSIMVQIIDVNTGYIANTEAGFPQNQPPGALANVPGTFNYQSPIGFRFFIKRLPEVNFYVQKVNVPGAVLPLANEVTPFLDMPQPGDHVQYEPLQLTFLVTEGLENYIELQKWLLAIGDAAGGKAYEKLATASSFSGHQVKSEIILSIEDSSKQQKMAVVFHDAWPAALSGLNFDATEIGNIQYLTASVAFRYINYTWEPTL